MNGLQKKLGPLKVWQWAAIGAALGLAILIYKSREGQTEGTGEIFGGTGTGAFGPVDPETGIPYSFESGGGAGGAGGESLDQFLARVEQLKEAGLLGGEGEPAETVVERVVENGNKAVQQAKAKQKHDQRGGGKGSAGSGKNGKGKGTSTGAGASQGGGSHTSAPHPATRVAVGGATALTGATAGQHQGGGASAKIKQAPAKSGIGRGRKAK